MMDKFVSTVKNYINEEKLLNKGDSVVIGVSGGADSIALFDVLYELKDEMSLKLFVVHVNHGLREEASIEAEYVRNLCKERGIPFYLKEADVVRLSREWSLGTEETGRKVRYEFFDEIMKETNSTKIAVAHNKNDRAETMLFNLVRGTGLKGLVSIEAKRGSIIRPLLDMERKDIEDYLNRRNEKFFTDKTNLENDYSRNRIRNLIFPMLESELNEAAVLHIGECAKGLGELNEYVMKEVEEAFSETATVEKGKVTFNKELFLKKDNYICKQLVKRAIDELVPNNKDITHVHIDSVISLLSKSGTKAVNLPYGIEAACDYTTIVLRICSLDIEETGLEKWKITKEVFDMEEGFDYGNLAYTKCFDCDKIDESLVLRYRQQGDTIVVDSKGSKKKLKDYMINEKIPMKERDKIPVLACGSEIIWVVGYRISEAFKISKETKRVLKITVSKEV